MADILPEISCHPTGSDYRDWICDRPLRAWERGTFISRGSKACGRYQERSPTR